MVPTTTETKQTELYNKQTTTTTTTTTPTKQKDIKAGQFLNQEDAIFFGDVDAFDDAQHNHIELWYKQRRGRSTMTLVQGLPDTADFKALTVAWRKWGTSVVLKKMKLPGREADGDRPALILGGDHRGKIAHWLVSSGACMREELTIHGPPVTDSPTGPAKAPPTTSAYHRGGASTDGTGGTAGCVGSNSDDDSWDSDDWDEVEGKDDGEASSSYAFTSLSATTATTRATAAPAAPAAPAASRPSRLSLLTRTMRGEAPMLDSTTEPAFQVGFAALFQPKQKSQTELEAEAKAKAAAKAKAEAKAAWKVAKAEEAAAQEFEHAPISALTPSQVEEWRTLERDRKPWADNSDTEAILFGMALKKFRKTLSAEGTRAVKRGWDAWQFAHENCFVTTNDGSGAGSDQEGGDDEVEGAAEDPPSWFVAPAPKASGNNDGMDLLSTATTSSPTLSKKERKRLKRGAKVGDTKASLQTFFADTLGTGRPSSLPTQPRHVGSSGGSGGVVLDESKLPREPPYTAFVGNLPYGAEQHEVERAVRDFFGAVGARCNRFRSPRDGFGYAEFNTVDELKLALGASGGRLLVGSQSNSLRIDQAEGSNNSSSRGNSNRSRGSDYSDYSSSSSGGRGGVGGYSSSWRERGSGGDSSSSSAPQHRSYGSADTSERLSPSPTAPSVAPTAVRTPRHSYSASSRAPAGGSQAEQLGTPESRKARRCTACTRALPADGEGRLCSRCTAPAPPTVNPFRTSTVGGGVDPAASNWRRQSTATAPAPGEREGDATTAGAGSCGNSGGMYRPPPPTSRRRQQHEAPSRWSSASMSSRHDLGRPRSANGWGGSVASTSDNGTTNRSDGTTNRGSKADQVGRSVTFSSTVDFSG